MKQIIISEKELHSNGGLEIVIPGTAGSPEDPPGSPCPVFIESYKQEVRVIIWNGTEVPTIIPLKRAKTPE